ncbi:PD40 domain-containing protein [Flagellimonas meridianipacifica]|uniref:WD40 repeat protein n=1 Tax=Flagellimonas meridianipacifica TaxID=1080225 RepID=A0A2T0MAQ5_9FLAO|nr:PD40 domain-containing protein [Allomuricauda pacifica]PRX54569.1 WD40 repeat protein [Allomuricauda pacifica]
MTHSITYRLVLILSFTLSISLSAQTSFDTAAQHENDQRVEDYLDLLKQGYSEVEIFQDLGNANFLAGNYETAVFWYEKLLSTHGISALETNYEGLFQFAQKQLEKGSNDFQNEKNLWDEHIQSHYSGEKLNQGVASKEAVENKMKGKLSTLDGYMPSMTVTQDGQTAYFSKATYQKPLYGVFSKKELVHEIFRVENIDGKWKNATKVAVCPKYASAKHPTISADGKRLFFASNMKGSYGNYDIYVVDIKSNGKLGIVKNLGPKVNTKEDELYPNLYNGTLLFFASAGRKGYGGLDLYATQVAKSSLTSAVNLGGHINSNKDDYSIALNLDKGTGYVVSNRGQNSTIAQYAVSYGKQKNENTAVANRENRLKNILNSESTEEYSNTAFED